MRRGAVTPRVGVGAATFLAAIPCRPGVFAQVAASALQTPDTVTSTTSTRASTVAPTQPVASIERMTSTRAIESSELTITGNQHFNGDTENSSFSIEGRSAFAEGQDPAQSHHLRRIGRSAAAEAEGAPDLPDAYEFRPSHGGIGGRFEWAFNAFFERENVGDRGREWGFAQSIQTPILLPRERLKAGIEMQYQNFTVKDTRGSPIHRFNIGPSFSFKPAAHMRLDLTPLFGVTDDSPRVQVFAIFSYVFGGGDEGNEAEAPASTRNR